MIKIFTPAAWSMAALSNLAPMESKELGILSIGSIITGIDSVASVSAIRQASLAPRKTILI